MRHFMAVLLASTRLTRDAGSLMKLTHNKRLMKAVEPVRQGWSKKRERVRWSLTFFVYFAWFSTCIYFYIVSLMKLVMLGDNPFDYGQVAYILVSSSRSRLFSSRR